MVQRLSLAVLFVAAGVSLAACPDGAVYFAQTDKCFRYYRGFNSGSQADGYCVHIGGQLASIHSQAENDFIYNNISTDASYRAHSYPMWIGLRYNGTIGKYAWLDGTPVSYTNWDAKQPIYSQDCVYLSSNGTWVRQGCDELNYPSVCEVPKSSTPALVAEKAAVPSTMAPYQACPGSALRFNDRCFMFSMFGASYTDANNACIKQKGSLVSVHTKAENDWMTQHCKNINMQVAWIGFNKVSGQNFTWTDKSTIDYTNWNTGVPGSCKNGAQNCVNLEYTTGTWYNCWACSQELPYICEVPALKNSFEQLSNDETHIRQNIDKATLLNLKTGY